MRLGRDVHAEPLQSEPLVRVPFKADRQGLQSYPDRRGLFEASKLWRGGSMGGSVPSKSLPLRYRLVKLGVTPWKLWMVPA